MRAISSGILGFIRGSIILIISSGVQFPDISDILFYIFYLLFDIIMCLFLANSTSSTYMLYCVSLLPLFDNPNSEGIDT